MAVALTACSLGRAVEEGLTYKFHAAWSSVLQLLCVFFEVCGRQAHPVMKKVSWGAAGAWAGSGTWSFGLWAPRRGLWLCYLCPSTLPATTVLIAGAQDCVSGKVTGPSWEEQEEGQDPLHLSLVLSGFDGFE